MQPFAWKSLAGNILLFQEGICVSVPNRNWQELSRRKNRIWQKKESCQINDYFSTFLASYPQASAEND